MLHTCTGKNRCTHAIARHLGLSDKNSLSIRESIGRKSLVSSAMNGNIWWFGVFRFSAGRGYERQWCGLSASWRPGLRLFMEIRAQKSPLSVLRFLSGEMVID